MVDRRDVVAMWDALAARYHAELISPFDAAVSFQLRTDLDRLLVEWQADHSLERRVVGDFGCGCGDGLTLLAGQVGIVVGIDFSEAMLDCSECALRNGGFVVGRHSRAETLDEVVPQLRPGQGRDIPAVVLVNADLLSLSGLRGRFDLALAINSISPSVSEEAPKMIQQVTSCINDGGTLIAVFPSLDTMHYLFGLVEQFKVSLPDLGFIEADGVYVDATGRQKLYEPDEIRMLLAQASMKVDRMEKIHYPWELIARHGWGNFSGQPPLWDWYVVARRASAT